jgi:hypothetical protein
LHAWFERKKVFKISEILFERGRRNVKKVVVVVGKVTVTVIPVFASHATSDDEEVLE